jgi:hypothetical protein
MKKVNQKIKQYMFLGGFVVVILMVTLFISCKKDLSQNTPAPNIDDTYKLAEIVSGKVFSGSITSTDEENLQSINLNNGSQFVLVQSIPGQCNVKIPASPFAELVTSSYGVIIKDKAHNGLLLLANNDAESIRKFKQVEAALHNLYKSAVIYGTTIINNNKS